MCYHTETHARIHTRTHSDVIHFETTIINTFASSTSEETTVVLEFTVTGLRSAIFQYLMLASSLPQWEI